MVLICLKHVLPAIIMNIIVRPLDPDPRLHVHILRVGSTYFRIVIWINWFYMDSKL